MRHLDECHTRYMRRGEARSSADRVRAVCTRDENIATRGQRVNFWADTLLKSLCPKS